MAQSQRKGRVLDDEGRIRRIEWHITPREFIDQFADQFKRVELPKFINQVPLQRPEVINGTFQVLTPKLLENSNLYKHITQISNNLTPGQLTKALNQVYKEELLLPHGGIHKSALRLTEVEKVLRSVKEWVQKFPVHERMSTLMAQEDIQRQSELRQKLENDLQQTKNDMNRIQQYDQALPRGAKPQQQSDKFRQLSRKETKLQKDLRQVISKILELESQLPTSQRETEPAPHTILGHTTRDFASLSITAPAPAAPQPAGQFGGTNPPISFFATAEDRAYEDDLNRRWQERERATVPTMLDDPLYRQPHRDDPHSGYAPGSQMAGAGGPHTQAYGGQQGAQPRPTTPHYSGSGTTPRPGTGLPGSQRTRQASPARLNVPRRSTPPPARVNVPRRSTPPPTDRPHGTQSEAQRQAQWQQPHGLGYMPHMDFGMRPDENVPRDPPPPVRPRPADWVQYTEHQAAGVHTARDETNLLHLADTRPNDTPDFIDNMPLEGYGGDDWTDPALVDPTIVAYRERTSPSPAPPAGQKRPAPSTNPSTGSGSGNGTSGRQPRQGQPRKERRRR